MAPQETRFSNVEAVDEFAEYRAVSKLSIASVVLAFLSSLTLLHPMFWILPFIVVALASSALLAISKSNSTLGGRKAAIFALLLAICLGFWGPTRALSRQGILGQQSRRCAEAWLKLIQEGELEKAYSYQLDPFDRNAPPPPPDQDPMSAENPDRNDMMAAMEMQKEQKDAFFQSDPLKEIIDLGKKGAVQFVRNESIEERENRSTVILLFLMTPSADGAFEPFSFKVRLSLWPEGGNANWYWKIDSIDHV